MAAKILLLFVVALFSLSEQIARGNIKQGNMSVGYPIHYEIHDKVGIPFMKRDEDFEVRALDNELIRGVQVSDLIGNGESFIAGGGVGLNYVKIHLAGARGDPYRFLVEVRAS